MKLIKLSLQWTVLILKRNGSVSVINRLSSKATWSGDSFQPLICVYGFGVSKFVSSWYSDIGVMFIPGMRGFFFGPHCLTAVWRSSSSLISSGFKGLLETEPHVFGIETICYARFSIKKKNLSTKPHSLALMPRTISALRVHCQTFFKLYRLTFLIHTACIALFFFNRN